MLQDFDQMRVKKKGRERGKDPKSVQPHKEEGAKRSKIRGKTRHLKDQQGQ